MTPVAQPTPHTPTPWRVDTNFGFYVVSDKGGMIATCDDGNYFTNPGDGPINAAHIVHCVNSFDALTEALKECEDYFDNRADVNDGSYGEPIPNTEMRLLEVVRAALNQVKP